MHVALAIGWGASGCNGLDRDIDTPPPIAGFGDDGDDEDGSLDGGDAGGDQGGADGGDGGGAGGDPDGNGNGNGNDDGGSNDGGDPGDPGAGQDDGRHGISGKLKRQDGASVEGPVVCEVRVYAPEQIDPNTGAVQGTGLSFPMTVWSFPQHFDISAQELGNFPALSGYVAAYCDEDGDGTVDESDGIVAHYPELPMTLVPVPGAEEVWLYLGHLD